MEIDRNYSKYIVEQLLQLKYSETKPDSGICFSISTQITWFHDEVDEVEEYWSHFSKRMFRMWPEFSGSVVYPIKHPQSRYRQIEAYDTLPLWTGAYGASRYRLLDFLIENFIQHYSLHDQSSQVK